MRGLIGIVALGLAVAASIAARARAVDLEVGDLIVADVHHPVILNRGGGYDGRIIKVDPATGQQTLIASGGSISDPTGIAIDPAGRILTTDTLDFPGRLRLGGSRRSRDRRA